LKKNITNKSQKFSKTTEWDSSKRYI